jgi:SH3 domain protein
MKFAQRVRTIRAPQIRSAAWVTAMTLLAVLPAAVSHAQKAWVTEREVNLTLRTGAGTQYRIIGGIKTGDAVTILGRGEGWTKVRIADGKEGWVSEGFLQPSAPSRVALSELEREADSLRDQIETLSKETVELSSANEELSGSDDSQRAEIDRLTRENYELRAGARWPEWITGGVIVLVGLALGAILGRSSGRRRQQRIRL